MEDRKTVMKIVKCSGCAEKIMITTSKRPIVISCPRCGKKGRLSK
jgi:hypothetical protein